MLSFSPLSDPLSEMSESPCNQIKAFDAHQTFVSASDLHNKCILDTKYPSQNITASTHLLVHLSRSSKENGSLKDQQSHKLRKPKQDPTNLNTATHDLQIQHMRKGL